MHLELCTKDQFYEFLSEFDATQESLQSDVNYLKEWLEQQPHLPNVVDDEWLENFLLRGKNSIERTKKLLDRYYTARALFPDIFKNRDVFAKEFVEVKDFAVLLPVTKLTPDGHRVMIFRILERRENFPSVSSLTKAMQIIFDVCLKLDKVRGVILVYDMKNITPAFASLKINPIRYKKIYILNLPLIAQPIFNISLIMVKKKSDKVVVWKKSDRDLVEVIPKECLPVEYGGTEIPIIQLRDFIYEILKEYNDWIIQQETVKADLSLAPTQMNSDLSITDDVEGTFRKLNID